MSRCNATDCVLSVALASIASEIDIEHVRPALIIHSFLFPARFEELCFDLLDRIKTPVQTALDDAKLSFKDIQEVVLVGGR